MSNLTPYIKLDNVITTSMQMLEEINPQVFLFNGNEGDYYYNFNDLSEEAKLNNTFRGLLATGYNVLTLNQKDQIKFTFENNLKLDFKYCSSYRQIDFNPFNELVNELQAINCNFNELLDMVADGGNL